MFLRGMIILDLLFESGHASIVQEVPVSFHPKMITSSETTLSISVQIFFWGTGGYN